MITVISGTNRPQSKTRQVAQLVLDYYRDAQVATQLVDLHELPRELFVPEHYASKPESFQPFQDKILKTNGILIVTPEYNGSFPGALKYFIDMLKFPDSFREMPVAFMGVAAGQFGAIRSIEQLELILQYRGAHLYGRRTMFPRVTETLSADGRQIQEDFIRQMFAETLQGFAGFISRANAD